MTRGIILTTARKKLGETTQSFWEDTLLWQWCEDAQLDAVWRAKVNRQRSLATTVASTVRYTLTDLIADCLRIFKVRVYNSSTTNWTRVTQKNQDWLDDNYPNWNTAGTGAPMFYYYDTDMNEFVLYPSADSDHVGADYLEIYNSTKPTAMANDGASPDMPEVLHPAVIEYVVATGLESRGYEDISAKHWNTYYGLIRSYQTEKNWEEDQEIIMKANYR